MQIQNFDKIIDAWNDIVSNTSLVYKISNADIYTGIHGHQIHRIQLNDISWKIRFWKPILQYGTNNTYWRFQINYKSAKIYDSYIEQKLIVYMSQFINTVLILLSNVTDERLLDARVWLYKPNTISDYTRSGSLANQDIKLFRLKLIKKLNRDFGLRVGISRDLIDDIVDEQMYTARITQSLKLCL